MKNKSFNEDKIIEIIVIPVIIVFALLVWWLVQASQIEPEEETTIYYGEFIGDEIPTETQIVENSVESVENTTEAKELETFKITGYTPTCSHCCLKSDGIGSSGRKIEAGKSVAMNRQDMKKHDLKYGDKIYIVGIGERTIEDTGCKQGVIDIACDSHESCYKVTGFYKVERVEVI
jgi:3D (Asp-Asp-Asp) domain-containing protein